MAPVERIRKALDLERIKYTRAIETINEEAHVADEAATADLSRRGLYHSGEHVSKIARIDEDCARKMIQKMIELRRETLRTTPEAATEALFNELLKDAYETIERVFDLIPEHIKRRGIQLLPSLIPIRFQDQIPRLKAAASRDIELMKREFELQRAPASPRPAARWSQEMRRKSSLCMVETSPHATQCSRLSGR